MGEFWLAHASSKKHLTLMRRILQQGLTDIARLVTQRVLNPRFLS